MIIEQRTPAELREKILGCWMGKNCGGTLGGPLEKAFSQPEPFNVNFYPEIREGGIPNDDLEIQLIWLKALEELGLDLKAQDLADYWLDHVGYNPDEYGMMMTNLRLGLQVPMAGFYNNYFRDCMGCPIRTEIWACIAAGHPRVAARYALLDSIVDHAGGESIYGALFNVSIEAAAFVISDPKTLLDIGLSYLPPESITARCIRAAIDAHGAGKDWLGAREEVLKIGGHMNSMFSPPNIAFQVIGWLYGAEFGDAICKAVNCGYDTDCTGATLGSIYGIIGGLKSLPKKWTAPLGDTIATSDPTGVKNFYKGSHPAPRTIAELTDRTEVIARQITARYGPPSHDLADYYADPELQKEVLASPTAVPLPLSAKLRLILDGGSTPQIGGDAEKKISLEVRNDHPEAIDGTLRIQVPEGWKISPDHAEVSAPAFGNWKSSFVLRSPGRARLENSNRVLFNLQPRYRPAAPAPTTAFIGAPVWLSTAPFGSSSATAADLLAAAFAPEKLQGAVTEKDARGEGWQIFESDGNDVGTPFGGNFRGVRYLRGFWKSASDRETWLHVCSSVAAKVWLNGDAIMQSTLTGPMRPSYYGTPECGLAGAIKLKAGWNELFIKFAIDEKSFPFKCHVLHSNHKNGFTGIVDALWTRFPWEEKA
jgi:ADP-ribosylglycohydrolase